MARLREELNDGAAIKEGEAKPLNKLSERMLYCEAMLEGGKNLACSGIFFRSFESI